MFDYSVKIKAILIGALLVLIGFLIFLINFNNSHSRDLDRVSQAKEIAASLEYYFDKNNAYPEIGATKLNAIQVITEQGINQTGDYVYFKANNSQIEGTLVASLNRYVIEFDLGRKKMESLEIFLKFMADKGVLQSEIGELNIFSEIE